MRKPVFVVITACTLAAPGAAQNTLPGLENFTLERPQPTPTVTPTSSPTVTPSPLPTAAPSAAVTARPDPTATPAPRDVPRVRAPESTPTPTVEPSSAVEPTLPTEPSPSAIGNSSTPVPQAEVEPNQPSSSWALWGGVAALLLGGIGLFLWWRRRRTDSDAFGEEQVASEPARAAGTAGHAPLPPLPEPVPSVEPARPIPASVPAALPGGLVTSSLKRSGRGGLVTSTLQPELRIGLVPLRGGVDTLRATVEYQLQITNAGRGTARSVTVEAWLTSASHQTATDLAQLFASSGGVPMLAPFDLTANAAIDLAGVGAVAREQLATITAGDRRMFVPVLAARVVFVDGGGARQVVTAAFLIGIARDGQDRLAPLPLDRGAITHDRLAVRPYGS